MNTIEIEFKNKSITFESEDAFNVFLKQNDLEVDSGGNILETTHVGMIPTILAKWFQERKAMRKKAAECKKAGDNDGYFFNNQRQQVWKIMLNSMYGVLGLSIFRFYDLDNAAAVTTSGVSIIKTTALVINSYYKKELNVKEGNWVVYTDTDSCFVDAGPIIKKRNPDINLTDDTAMTTAIMQVTSEVQKYVNDSYNILAKKFFNLDKHTLDAKQEVISKTSFWLAKKRYAQWIIHKEGALLKEPELEVKGIDVVRTSYPAAFRKFLEIFLRKLLVDTPREELDKLILDFKEKIKTLPVIDLAKNTSVKYISGDGTENYAPANRKPFQFLKGTPVQVKGALAYNDLLSKFKIDKQYEKIYHGQKIKYLYLKDNEFGLPQLAFKADDTDPKQVLTILETYIDRNEMFERELKSKVTEFYKVMKWEFPNTSMKVAAQFFEF